MREKSLIALLLNRVWAVAAREDQVSPIIPVGLPNSQTGPAA
jgi:hypothetical protein